MIFMPRGSARRTGSRIAGERGQALVEFLIVFPLLVLLIFGIIEMGAAWRTYQVVTNAAREGARITVVASGNQTEAEVRAAIAERLTEGGLVPGDATIAFDCGAGDCFGSGKVPGESAEVQISYPYTFTLLGPIADYVAGNGDAYGTVTMQTGFVMRIE